MMRSSLRLLSAGFLFALAGAAAADDCPRPVTLRFDITGKIVRSEVGFTQGLEWRDGKLFESTGAVGGRSGLNTVAPDGTVWIAFNGEIYNYKELQPDLERRRKAA